MTDDFPFRLKSEDDAEAVDVRPDAAGHPVHHRDISGVAETSLLEMAGFAAAAKRRLMQSFDMPMSPNVRRAIRDALGSVEQIIQAADEARPSRGGRHGSRRS